jgi:hypothetical protein
MGARCSGPGCPSSRSHVAGSGRRASGIARSRRADDGRGPPAPLPLPHDRSIAGGPMDARPLWPGRRGPHRLRGQHGQCRCARPGLLLVRAGGHGDRHDEGAVRVGARHPAGRQDRRSGHRRPGPRRARPGPGESSSWSRSLIVGRASVRRRRWADGRRISRGPLVPATCCSGLMCLLTSGEMIGRALTSAPSSPVS